MISCTLELVFPLAVGVEAELAELVVVGALCAAEVWEDGEGLGATFLRSISSLSLGSVLTRSMNIFILSIIPGGHLKECLRMSSVSIGACMFSAISMMSSTTKTLTFLPKLLRGITLASTSLSLSSESRVYLNI